MGEAMSEERLAEVRRRHGRYRSSHNHMGAFACCSAHDSADTVPELLAEVERLRAQLAEIGETREEWGVRIEGANFAVSAASEAEAHQVGAGFSRHKGAAGYDVVRRLAGEWREVPDA